MKIMRYDNGNQIGVESCREMDRERVGIQVLERVLRENLENKGISILI